MQLGDRQLKYWSFPKYQAKIKEAADEENSNDSCSESHNFEVDFPDPHDHLIGFFIVHNNNGVQSIR